MGARRRIGRRLGAAALGTIAALGLCELGYRALRESRLGPTTHPAYVVHDAELGWSYRPGARARHASPEFDVEVRIHSRGFRGAEWELDAPGRRLVVLGDSFAFGWGVEDHETVGARTAAALEDWRAFELGVSGFGTGQELLALRRWVGELRPDAVAVVFCENDLYESATPASYGKRKPWFELSEGALRLHGQPVEQGLLERWSHLWRAWEKRRWERSFARESRDPDADWELAFTLLSEMRTLLDTEGLTAPLILLSENVELERFAANYPRIEHVDLRATLARAGAPVRFAVDGHWTPEGHARVARELARRLAELPR